MGQEEVKNFLNKERKLSNKWFTIPEIKERLKVQGLSNGQIHQIYNNLYQLAAFNVIEWKGIGVWSHRKVFRGRK